MPHVGNDIVDLKHPGAREKNRNIRFIRRVLTPDEQARIAEARHPDVLLWAFWAGKETAYKIAVKIRPGASSIPRLYEVDCPDDVEGDADGTVNTPVGRIRIRFCGTSDYIHCVGVAGSAADMEKIVSEVQPIGMLETPAGDDESRSVREAAGKGLARHLQVEPGAIDIRRTEGAFGLGPPSVYCLGMRADMDISLSHDGRFAAYAFLGPFSVI